MTIKLNINRTFRQEIAVEIDNDGELIEGTITAHFKMPKLSEYQANLEASREISVLMAKLQALGPDATSDQVEALSNQIDAIVSDKKDLLKNVLHSIDGIEYVGDNGKPLKPAEIVKAAIDDIEISKVLLQAYNVGLEQKMAPKKAISDDTPGSDSPAVLEA